VLCVSVLFWCDSSACYEKKVLIGPVEVIYIYQCILNGSLKCLRYRKKLQKWSIYSYHISVPGMWHTINLHLQWTVLTLVSQYSSFISVPDSHCVQLTKTRKWRVQKCSEHYAVLSFYVCMLSMQQKAIHFLSRYTVLPVGNVVIKYESNFTYVTKFGLNPH
jgi:hypothetical protein